jgi:putative cell wall-binding protein
VRGTRDCNPKAYRATSGRLRQARYRTLNITLAVLLALTTLVAAPVYAASEGVTTGAAGAINATTPTDSATITTTNSTPTITPTSTIKNSLVIAVSEGTLEDVLGRALAAEEPGAGGDDPGGDDPDGGGPGGPDGGGPASPDFSVLNNLAISGSLNDADFLFIRENLSALTSLDLSATSLTALPANALKGLSQLASVTLPSSVTSLGAAAFYGCTALASINLDSLQTLGSSAFYGCTALTALSLPKIQSIGTNAFLQTGLKTLVLPATPPAVGGAGSLGTGSRPLAVWVPQKEPYRQAANLPAGALLRAYQISPPSLSITQGETITLEAICEDTAATTFQWYCDGVKLAAATAATLSIPAATPANSGSYTLSVNGLTLALAADVTVSKSSTPPEDPKTGGGPDDPPPSEQTPLAATRVAGDDRYATAAAVALHGRASSDTVILATGLKFPDALVASGISGLEGTAPVLFTTPTGLPPATRAAITALGATRLIILGDVASISNLVELEARALVAKVERIGGADRYATAVAAFEKYRQSGFWSKTAIIATGATHADALSIAPWAVRSHSPLFFVDSSATGLTAATRQALAKGGFEQILAVGNSAAVSEAVVNAALQSAGLTRSPATFTRLGASTRYGTSVAIAKWASSAERGASRLSFAEVALARGDIHADALAGGALQGRSGSVLLLVHADASSLALQTLTAHAAEVSELRFLGGEEAVPEVLAQLYKDAIPQRSQE